jgi:hypothetical protein
VEPFFNAKVYSNAIATPFVGRLNGDRAEESQPTPGSMSSARKEMEHISMARPHSHSILLC